MSFPAYPAYKQSDVEWLGEVPEHWILTPLKHLALLNPRKSGYDGDTEQLCSFVPMEKLKTGVVQLDEERPIADVIGGYTYFEDGDVLQAKVTPCFENMNVAIAKGLTNGIGFGSSEINVLRPYQGVNAEYLFYRVQEGSYMSFCTSSMIGAGGLKRVPTDVINNFKIAAPELFEQTQIARFLDHETARIDALIEEQQRLIELLKEKRQAVISHAVTKGLDPTVPMKDSGVEWLGEVPAHWGLSKLKFLCNIQTGDKDTVNAKEDGEYDFFVRSQTVERIDSFTFDCEAVLTAGDGVGVGKVFHYANGKFDFHQRVYMLNKFRLVCGEFVFHYLRENFYKVALAGEAKSTVDSLRMPTFLNFMFTVPPQAEQIQIIKFVKSESEKFDSLVSEAEVGVSLLKERRSALISAAVTGKIDVRGWQPPASTQAPELEVAEAD